MADLAFADGSVLLAVLHNLSIEFFGRHRLVENRKKLTSPKTI
jgi:hypothetical protein